MIEELETGLVGDINTMKDSIYIIEKNPDFIFPTLELKKISNLQELQESLGDLKDRMTEGKPLCECITVYYDSVYEEFYNEKKPAIECPECGDYSGVYDKVERYRLQKKFNRQVKQLKKASEESEVGDKQGELEKF